MAHQFPLSLIANLLVQARQPPPPEPVVVNIDFEGLAKMLSDTEFKIKHGTTVVPS